MTQDNSLQSSRLIDPTSSRNHRISTKNTYQTPLPYTERFSNFEQNSLQALPQNNYNTNQKNGAPDKPKQDISTDPHSGYFDFLKTSNHPSKVSLQAQVLDVQVSKNLFDAPAKDPNASGYNPPKLYTPNPNNYA